MAEEMMGNGEGINENKECTCRQCGITYVPSFEFDFYADDPDVPAVGRCEDCFMTQSMSVRNPVPLPDENYEDRVCKIGQGKLTCSFLGSKDGIMHCLKGSNFEGAIRERLAAGTLGAKGDNCSGPPNWAET